MPLMRFIVLTDQVRNHQKRQTMRRRRKNPLKKDDLLHVYVQEKLGTAPIISLKTKKLRNITLEDAHKDGFMTIHDCQETLMKMHKCGLDEKFDIIGYDPNWKANMVVNIDIKELIKALYEPIRRSVECGNNSEPYRWGYKQAILDVLKIIKEVD